MEAALDDAARPQVLWTFLNESPSPQERLVELLSLGTEGVRIFTRASTATLSSRSCWLVGEKTFSHKLFLSPRQHLLA